MDPQELLTLKLAAALRLAIPPHKWRGEPSEKDILDIAKSLMLMLPSLKVTIT